MGPATTFVYCLAGLALWMATFTGSLIRVRLNLNLLRFRDSALRYSISRLTALFERFFIAQCILILIPYVLIWGMFISPPASLYFAQIHFLSLDLVALIIVAINTVLITPVINDLRAMALAFPERREEVDVALSKLIASRRSLRVYWLALVLLLLVFGADPYMTRKLCYVLPVVFGLGCASQIHVPFREFPLTTSTPTVNLGERPVQSTRMATRTDCDQHRQCRGRAPNREVGYEIRYVRV